MGLLKDARVSWTFKREIKGPTYRALLQWSLCCCTQGMVVVRPQLSLGQSARAFLERLTPFRIASDNDYPWLGAQLFDSKAELWRFRLTPECLALILESSGRLYQWEQPDLPEDLCLFRADGSDGLVTMAHNRTGYLSLSREERTALESELPKLPIAKG